MAEKMPVGGGPKKVLYTLQTVQKIGVGKAAKALNSKNACKACGLGMGGQRGGMRNELDEFPSVCNKSVQAQSTDIQPAIPEEIFAHSIEDLRELTPRELEKLGRLGTPVFKAADADRYEPIGWDRAMEIAAQRLRATDPQRSFFYSSGRSSNEAGFLFQLIARLYGTNNVTNCSYYCHQATSVALEQTIGTGTATVELEDLTLSDCIFVIGANPASNHPRFVHLLKRCRERGGEVIVINPAKEPGLVKFAVPKSPKSMLSGGTEIASAYLQPRIGEDIVLIKGIAKAILEAGQAADGFIADHTDGFEAFCADIDKISWNQISERSGVSREEIESVARIYAKSKSAVFAWGMGMTHHIHGVENIEYISNLALLRGMIGRPGAGLLPLRGHSNVQGIGTIGVKPVLAETVVEKIEAHFGIALPEARGLDTLASMQAAHDGKIDAAVVMGGNLYAATPRTDWAETALNRIGFKLSLTTTLNAHHLYGHDESESLILPVTARDEEWEPTTQESMFNYIRLSDGGINRLDNVRPESVILADLAERILVDCPIDFQEFARHSEVRKAIAKIVPGMEQLADIDVAKREFQVQNRIMHETVFHALNGRAQFRISAPKTQWSAPFKLSTIRSEGQFNSIIYEEKDSYRDTDKRWSILMNQRDMADLGLTQGDTADIRSDYGEMRGVTVFGFDLPRQCVMAYYPEANLLTGCETDPRSHTPSFKATGIWIEAAASA